MTIVRLCVIVLQPVFIFFCSYFESFVVLYFFVVFLHFLCLSLVVVFQLFEAVVLLLKVVVFGCYCRFDSLRSCFISRGSFCFSLKPFCIAGGRLASFFWPFCSFLCISLNFD